MISDQKREQNFHLLLSLSFSSDNTFVFMFHNKCTVQKKLLISHSDILLLFDSVSIQVEENGSVISAFVSKELADIYASPNGGKYESK